MRNRSAFDMEMNLLLQEASCAIPEGFEIVIRIVRGEASLCLMSPDGADIPVCTDDLDFTKSIQACVEEAVAKASEVTQ